MRQPRAWSVLLVLTGTSWVAGPASFAEDRKYQGTTYPVVRWSGTVADPGLERKRPDNGLVTNQKDFAALWKAWGVGAPVPDIDFATHFVVVVTKTKQPAWLVGLFNSSDGDSSAGFMSDEREACPGFGFGLGLFPRDKVKTIDGKAVPKE